MKYYFIILGLIIGLSSCKTTPYKLQKIKGELLPIDTTILVDNTVDQSIAPYRERLEKKMNKVLSYCPTGLYKTRNQAQTDVGNFMADLCYQRGNALFNNKTGKSADFCLLNFGGIRADVPKGIVKLQNAYELMPFENTMVVVRISYEKLQDLFQYLAKTEKAHPFSKQLKMLVENQKNISSFIDGKKPKKNRDYYIITSDYLQRGGDHMDFFKEPIELIDLQYKIRQAVIDEFTERDTIKAFVDNRMIKR